MQMSKRSKGLINSTLMFKGSFSLLLISLCLINGMANQALAQQVANPAKSADDSQNHSSGKTDSEFDKKNLENLNIDELSRACLKHGEKMHKQLLEYTYNLKKVRRTLNELGKEMEKEEGIFEAYPVKGEHVLITLSRNGRRLPLREMEVARQMAGRELEIKAREEERQKGRLEGQEREADNYFSAGIMGKYRGRNGQISINPADFFRLCELSAPRLKQIDERDVIVLKFRPRANVKFPYPKAYIAKLVGEVWIDVMDNALVRIEGWPSPEHLEENKTHPRQAKEPVLIFEQKRQKGGDWFPTFIRMNSEGDESLFNGLNWDVEFEFTEYKKFNTGIGDVKVQSKEKEDK
jgi:hypothetical protein